MFSSSIFGYSSKDLLAIRALFERYPKLFRERRWVPLTLLVVMLLPRGLAGELKRKHPVTLDDLLGLKGGGLVLNLSPDGHTLAYSYGGELWLLSTEGRGKPQKLGAGRLPVWSPDGEKLAYYCDRFGSTQLWVFDTRVHRSAQLTSLSKGINPDPSARMLGFFTGAFRMSWSPDGARIVFASRAHSQQVRSAEKALEPWIRRDRGGPLVLTDDTPADWTLRGVFAHGFGAGSWKNGRVSYNSTSPEPLPEVNQLFIVNLRTRMVQQLTEDDRIYFDPQWAPNGRYIICSSSDGPSAGAANVPGTALYRIEVANGEKKLIVKGADDAFMPSWSPDGEFVAYWGGRHFGVEHVIIIGADGSSPKVLAPTDRWVQEFRWMPDGKSIALDYRDGVTTSVAEVDVETNQVHVLSGPEMAYRNGLTVSQSGSVAWQESGAATVGLVRMVRAGEGIAQVILDLNPQIKTWELGDQQVVRWKNSRGEDLQGILIKPVGYRESDRYPMIVDAYPMQPNSFKGAMSGNQALAARGYAVFWPDAPAPHVWMNGFQSEAYSRSAQGPRGWEVTFDDVISGVNELIARGIADPNRMCLYGFSNGGGIVDDLITRTNRFRCAISVGAAVSDWLRPVLLDTDSKFQEFEGADDPWTDPAPYVELSAIFRLKNVETPLLLADGDEDSDFLLNTIEMYNGMRHFGKSVTLLRYPGQEHGFTGAALRDFWSRENAFFDRYLKP